ncbi:MAG: 4-oxalocrotonate tautomerase [Paludibacterium sp.]|nr:4-oxalocrotonate tautomerase [Paludibacterium sp.]MBV8646978.1 4-oxalocrotonate tautomerase [Paludibacterium sp.]
MPLLHLTMHPGRSEDQKRDFVREVTKVAVETLACPLNSVEIIITEVPKNAWATGGTLKSDQG